MEISQNQELPSKGSINNLSANHSTPNNNLSNILQHLQDDTFPKLTMGSFFEFMRTAYQVTNSFDNLPTFPNANCRIHWDMLGKIDLNLDTYTHNLLPKESDAYNETDYGDNSTQVEKEKLGRMENCNNLQTNKVHNEDSMKTTSSNLESHNEVKSTLEDSNQVDDLKTQNSYIQDSAQQLETVETKEYGVNDKDESILTTAMKKNLSDVLHEGLLDTVLPYMIPKQTLSQPSIKKATINTDLKKPTSVITNGQIKSCINLSTHKEKDKEKERNKLQKKLPDTEVEIHVCDEDKNIKKNFRCPQKLLIQNMCYFAEVTAGQKLEEIDISVHCDVAIFDWLMRWVKKEITKKTEWPVLEVNNVIPIMVSASFLQMDPLLESCIEYCHVNMAEILKTPTVLTCLDDNLLTSLADRFTNEDVEALKDKKDKIQSKLFCKFIQSLADPIANHKKGHYSSLSTLFKCTKCGKRIIQSVSSRVPCIANAMRVDTHGNIHSKHLRDLTWTLSDYIVMLRAELRSWRKVYWRLWGDCHFLFCQQCNTYFSINHIDWCGYHPELPQFFVNDQDRSIPYPLGRYPCCSQRAYRFEALPNHEGCKYKGHIPEIRSQVDTDVLCIFSAHKDVIALEPPQLFFPEKITRLVARDSLSQPGKLICKDVMWWNGMELVPSRPKFGLLGKVWSTGGHKHHIHQESRVSQKLQRHTSTATDTSSPASSTSESDENEIGTMYDASTADEGSHSSDESNMWTTTDSTHRIKKQSRNQILKTGNARYWSGNLSIRHNQDNQRDFEEKAAIQMITLLTKRISATSSLLQKPSNKQNGKRAQPIGGTYIKLEAQFREEMAQPCKYKNLTGKTSVRLRPK